MIIQFDSQALEDLYATGETQDHKYKKLSDGIIKKYIKTVNYLRAARRIEDLYMIKSLHYE